MDQLNLLAPAIVALGVAILSLIYVKSITRHPKAKAPAASSVEDPQFPFEFTPPTVQADSEGNVTVRALESIH